MLMEYGVGGNVISWIFSALYVADYWRDKHEQGSVGIVYTDTCCRMRR